MSVDASDALVGWLRAHGDVFPLAGGRVWSAELPADEAANMPRCGVVVRRVGGSGPASAVQERRPRFDVTCYGATPKQARDLFDAVDLALQGLRRAVYASCLLHGAVLLAGGFETRDPDTHWPMVWGSFQVTVGTQEARP